MKEEKIKDGIVSGKTAVSVTWGYSPFGARPSSQITNTSTPRGFKVPTQDC
jgi:hypothetical protein